MQRARNTRREFLVAGYGSGATRGRNLGSPGYSYDFVVGLFEPLFRRCGDFTLIENPEADLAAHLAAARQRGSEPAFVCFRGLHDVVFAHDAPTIVVPAWEFPDVPDHEFAGNVQNNWVRVANESSLLMVHGEFTRDAFIRGGVRTPISIVPVPTPVSYFAIDDWDSNSRTEINRSAIILGGNTSHTASTIPICAHIHSESVVESTPSRPTRRSARLPLRKVGKETYKQLVRPLLPRWVDAAFTAGSRAAARELFGAPRDCVSEPKFNLSGVVYTSIFNPDDGRKNWEDLLSAFLIGLQDCDDATLVLKLIGRNRHRANTILARYRDLDLTHRCRVIVITDYLSDEEMLELTRASTYYVTSTRAEGNCLPLMNFLAAGRPAITPNHTAISDYFTDQMGFPVLSHAEPCAWPHDPQLRTRTTWQRLAWPSLVEALRTSYRAAKGEPARYSEMAAAGRAMSWRRHHPTSVLPRLQAALGAIIPATVESKHRRAAA